MVNKIFIGIIVAILLFMGGFFIFNWGDSNLKIGNINFDNDNIYEDNNLTPIDWREIPLKNVRTGESFKISDFNDKPILLESFAVWCPSCTSQQGKLKELHEELGDSFISISLDTDPNEDDEKVREHIETNGFDWRYAISPSDMTKSLVDEFGTSFLSAPSVPIVLICPDGSLEKLKSGSKSVEFLKEKIGEC